MGRARRTMTVDPPGQNTGVHLVLLWKELNTHEADEYIVVPCVPLCIPSMHWFQRFVFAQTSGRGERGERVER